MASLGELSPTEPYSSFYTCQDDLWSSHFLLPKIGGESAQAFHLYLQNWGIKLPILHHGINEIDHESPSSLNATQSYRWKDGQDLAKHIEHVAHALEGRGSGKVYQTKGDLVFIVNDASKKGCNNLTCPGAGESCVEMTKSPLSITLEPLLDWGTVEPASDMRVASGWIFAFRRSGPRMYDPLWTVQVKKLVPEQTRTYCLHCLEELMNRRAEAQVNIDRSVGQPQKARHHYFPGRPIQCPTSRSELYDLREGGEFDDDPSFEALVFSTAGSLQLDGFTEQIPYADSRDYASNKTNIRDSSLAVENNPTFVGDTGVSSRSQRLPRSSTPPLGHNRVDSVHSQLLSGSSSHYPFSKDNSRPQNLDTPSNRAFVQQDPTSVEQNEYAKLGSATLLKNSVPYFGTGHRQLGRDIDTNAACRFFTNHRIRRENMAKPKDIDIRNFFTVVNPQGPSTPQRAVKTKSVDYEEPDLSDDDFDDVKEENDSDAPDGEYTPIRNKGKARSKSISPRTKTVPSPKKKTPSPLSKPAGKVQQPNAPIYRKHDSPIDDSPPFGVAQAALESYTEHVPLKIDLICSCHKPARTNEVLIAQCRNKDCRLRWYHKDCLSMRGKLQARHGTFLCEQCQNEKHYTDLSRANGWTRTKMIQNEIGMPFTAQEMVATLGNTGNFQAVANPYGLATSASSTTLSPFAEPFTPGNMTATDAPALSHLAIGSEPFLGLEMSCPYFVTEAYTKADEHRREADDAWESAQMYGYDSNEWNEEMGEVYEEDEDVTSL
ncbi:hypothetical protein G6011_10222 [Alternaria panax]|uniref:Zinc finger PHD-type domain-containing protein n=1 Tax=Alternaria panax TaxID=48097 RepID=A0AAD4IBI6_9PLEO|nr:hypothetical protein G6011_10222 [Alternaria panax]